MEKYEISSLTMMMAMTHYFGQTREDKATMNIPFVMHLKGEFDKKKLEDALQKILSTKIMNTWFSVEDNRFFANEKEYVPYVLKTRTWREILWRRNFKRWRQLPKN